jgi:hypothetical protein
MENSRKPGWYGQPDLQPGQKRYWDGEHWTDKVSIAPGPPGVEQIAWGILLALVVIGGVVLFFANIADITSP